MWYDANNALQKLRIAVGFVSMAFAVAVALSTFLQHGFNVVSTTLAVPFCTLSFLLGWAVIWEGTGSCREIMIYSCQTAVLFGMIGLCVGIIGAGIYAPHSNIAPAVGIMVAAPVAAAIGAVIGAIVGAISEHHRRPDGAHHV